MSNDNVEIEIIEKVASHKAAFGFDRGILQLTSQKLRFTPKLSAITVLFTMVGAAIFFLGGILTFVLNRIYSSGNYPSLGADSGFIGALLFSIGMMAVGASMSVIAYVKRSRKEYVITLKKIKDIARRTRPNDFSITSEGGHKDRFLMNGRDEFLGEVYLAQKGDTTGKSEVPTSLVDSEVEDYPKYSVPAKYPGALLRLQTNYSTPNICCMCSEPAQDKKVKPKLNIIERNKKGIGSMGWAAKVQTPFTHPFPICTDCYKVYRRAKTAGSLGGVVGLMVGGAIFVLLYLSGWLTPLLAVIAAFFGSFLSGLSDVSTLLFYFALIAAAAAFFGGVGWLIAREWARDAIAARKVPQERKAFFKILAADKGIRVVRKPGFVAFGFLSKEFATAFSQMNGGIATAVDMPIEERRKSHSK